MLYIYSMSSPLVMVLIQEWKCMKITTLFCISFDWVKSKDGLLGFLWDRLWSDRCVPILHLALPWSCALAAPEIVMQACQHPIGARGRHKHPLRLIYGQSKYANIAMDASSHTYFQPEHASLDTLQLTPMLLYTLLHQFRKLDFTLLHICICLW